jgi:FPC/CPF motif-containing protein YcgG
MSRFFLKKSEVASSHAVSTWQSVMFSEFEAQMSSEARRFPCIFGVTGYRLDQLRYLFLDPFDIEVLGAQLAQFVAESRSHGPNTSLVVFSRPRPVHTLDAYYRKMWLTLDQLARRDKIPSRHHHVARRHASPIGGAG